MLWTLKSIRIQKLNFFFLSLVAAEVCLKFSVVCLQGEGNYFLIHFGYKVSAQSVAKEWWGIMEMAKKKKNKDQST